MTTFMSQFMRKNIVRVTIESIIYKKGNVSCFSKIVRINEEDRKECDGMILTYKKLSLRTKRLYFIIIFRNEVRRWILSSTIIASKMKQDARLINPFVLSIVSFISFILFILKISFSADFLMSRREMSCKRWNIGLKRLKVDRFKY